MYKSHGKGKDRLLCYREFDSPEVTEVVSADTGARHQP